MQQPLWYILYDKLLGTGKNAGVYQYMHFFQIFGTDDQLDEACNLDERDHMAQQAQTKLRAFRRGGDICEVIRRSRRRNPESFPEELTGTPDEVAEFLSRRLDGGSRDFATMLVDEDSTGKRRKLLLVEPRGLLENAIELQEEAPLNRAVENLKRIGGEGGRLSGSLSLRDERDRIVLALRYLFLIAIKGWSVESFEETVSLYLGGDDLTPETPPRPMGSGKRKRTLGAPSFVVDELELNSGEAIAPSLQYAAPKREVFFEGLELLPGESMVFGRVAGTTSVTGRAVSRKHLKVEYAYDNCSSLDSDCRFDLTDLNSRNGTTLYVPCFSGSQIDYRQGDRHQNKDGDNSWERFIVSRGGRAGGSCSLKLLKAPLFFVLLGYPDNRPYPDGERCPNDKLAMGYSVLRFARKMN